jgi:hypothetical protein
MPSLRRDNDGHISPGCTPANCAGAEPAGRLGALRVFFGTLLSFRSCLFPSLFLPRRRAGGQAFIENSNIIGGDYDQPTEKNIRRPF